MTDGALPLFRLYRKADYKQTHRLLDADLNSAILGGDTLSLTFRSAQGASPALLTLTTTPTGNGSSISGVDTSTGEFDVLVKSADSDTICTGLGLGLLELGWCHVGLTLTRSGVELVRGRTPIVIEPEV